MHIQPSPLAGKTVKIKATVEHFQYPDFGGSDFQVEDWWDRLEGKSWMNCNSVPVCIIYAMRSAGQTPIDDEVLYGHTGGLGHLVHISEVEYEE